MTRVHPLPPGTAWNDKVCLLHFTPRDSYLDSRLSSRTGSMTALGPTLTLELDHGVLTGFGPNGFSNIIVSGNDDHGRRPRKGDHVITFEATNVTPLA